MAPPRPRTKQATRPRTRVAAVRAEADAPESQRGGVQSLGRAFGIMEEIARHRDGIGLAELSKRVGLHNSTTFHLVQDRPELSRLSFNRWELDRSDGGWLIRHRTTRLLGSEQAPGLFRASAGDSRSDGK